MEKSDVRTTLPDAKTNPVQCLEFSRANSLEALDKIDFWAPSSEQNTFRVGDQVAHIQPKKESYNWHGTVVKFRDGGVEVCWKERKGARGGDVLFYQVCDLRLIR